MNTSALRYTPNYDPATDLVMSQFAGSDQDELFLQVRHRLLWFHKYLEWAGKTGHVDDSELTYDPESKMMFAKASVYIDGKLAGRSCAGMYYNPAFGKGDRTIGQTVATMAKGRALAHAGFGAVDALAHPAQPIPDNAEVKQSGIRRCDYDPVLTGELCVLEDGKAPYLNIRFRTYWFHQYVRQLAKMGMLSGESYIDDSDVCFVPEANLLIAKAKVVINGQVVGESSGSRPFDPDDPALYNKRSADLDKDDEESDLPVLMVCTSAYGRALANAGFGVTSNVLEDGSDVNCDTGIRVSKQPDGQLTVAPLYQVKGSGTGGEGPAAKEETPTAKDAKPEKTQPAEKRKGGRRRKPKEEKSTPTDAAAGANEDALTAQPDGKDEGALTEMPFEEASKFVVPYGGCKGLTVEEALGKDERIIRFYASDVFNNPELVDLKRASIAVLKHYNKEV